MSIDLEINKNKIRVNQNEFVKVPHNEYNNLDIKHNLGFLERISGLLNDLSELYTEKKLVIHDTSHGGFVAMECSKKYDEVYVVDENLENIKYNVENRNITNIKFSDYENPSVIYTNNKLDKLDCIILSRYNYECSYKLSESDLYLYVPISMYDKFYEEFRYYIKDNEFFYDNLIHYTMIVKNAGDDFEKVLLENLEIIDRWTILDTGSTDNTIDIIKRVLKDKKGKLYQEPFVDFKVSRNRCLDLAGDCCKFNLMLDDTYIIKGKLREFLKTVRGDQFSDSFSMYIKSDDVEYVSNRITKSDRGLRYIYRIHEVITNKNNKNVIVPFNMSHIFDYRCDYMENRTMERKEFDLYLLFKEVEDDPDDPRHYYYIAQTYNLLNKHELAYEYFLKRGNHHVEGFLQEKIDALFEAARIANFKLNKPWNECEELYKRAYELDKTRPDSLYFIGIHHYLEGNNKLAYEYFKQAYIIGYPAHAQYSLKPTLSYHFLPKFLGQLCYEMGEYVLGEDVCMFFLTHNKLTDDYYNIMKDWFMIYHYLNKIPKVIKLSPPSDIPILVFVADGGFNNWTGRDILSKGVGGSETHVIEMARYIQQSGKYKVVVFCKCDEMDVFEGVQYIPLSEYFSFVVNNQIDTVIVSRFSEYLPVAFKGNVQNVYLVVHDLTPSGMVIPVDKKLKKIFCLTEWHVSYMNQIFPSLSHLTVPLYYGIDQSKFKYNSSISKIKNKFIYSSFPNRGLLQLLQMWPRIVDKYKDASLHIYADVNGKWVNDVEPQMMVRVRELLEKYKEGYNIHYHGWVGKQELANAWLSSEYWLYPCTFMETFCLTALEAALSNTIVISNDLAALQNTVGDRGLVIKGDVRTDSWQNECIDRLFKLMENPKLKRELLDKNYKWASQLSWKGQAAKLLNEYLYDNSKQIKTPKVLDIGTGTGVPLIKLVKSINNSIGFGIDNYGEEIENSFNKNINISSLQKHIKLVNDDINKTLINFLKQGQHFDFINLNKTYEDYEHYTYCVLAFELLNKEGVLSNVNQVFLEKYKDKVKILESNEKINIIKINE